MTVATFAQPNFNVDDPTTYRGKLDGNTAVSAPIVDNFAPHAVATPNMTVQLDAGAIPGVGAMPVQVALQTSATLTAPTTNPRKDIVYIDAATGVIGVAIGTEAASPVDPAVPAGKIAIARLAMTVGMSSITNSIITDLRAPAMTAGGGATFTPITGNTTLSIGQSGGRFKLTGAATAVTLPTPIGNANVSYLLWGGDANTQPISPAASSFKMPDGTTPTSYSVTANQGIEVVSDGSVYQVVRMVGKQTGQTPTVGDNSTQLATTAFVQQNRTFPTAFESGEIGIIANSDMTVAHGLGAVPKLWKAVLRCKIAELGYSVGDEGFVMADTNPTNSGISAYINATNIGMVIQSTIYISQRSATIGTLQPITFNNWRIILRAWQ